MIASGYSIMSPNLYTERVYRVLKMGFISNDIGDVQSGACEAGVEEHKES